MTQSVSAPKPADVVLRVADASIRVVLVGQENDRLDVVAEQHPGVFGGERVWLQTSDGWLNVEVKSVLRLTEGVQLHLSRAAVGPSELPPPDEPAAKLPRASSGVGRKAMLVAALALALTWSTVPLIQRSLPQGLIALLNWRSPHEPYPQNVDPRLRRVLQTWGPHIFLTREIGAALEISPEQKLQIGEISQRSRRMLQQSSRAPSGADHSIEIQQLALEEAMSVLSPQQRQRWQLLLQGADERMHSTLTDDHPHHD